MTIIETRASWGARAPRGTSYLASAHGVKGHYTGGHVKIETLSNHDHCRAAVRGIQNGHMDGNGWNDIGYSMIVCSHDRAMVGRGPHVLPAANGSGLNSGHYAILVLVGTSGVTALNDNMKRAFYGARTYLREHGNAGTQIKGHRDGYATTCPGPHVYGWIADGAPLPYAPPVDPDPDPTPEPTEDDRMDYGAFGFSGVPAFPVPANVWTDVPWDTEYADPYGSHAGAGTSVLIGDPCQYTLEFGATVSAPVDTPVYVRTAEYRYHGTATPPVDVLEEVGDEVRNVLGSLSTVHFSAVGSVQDGRKLRVQVLSPVAVSITRARVRYLAQR